MKETELESLTRIAKDGCNSAYQKYTNNCARCYYYANSCLLIEASYFQSKTSIEIAKERLRKLI